MTPPIVAVAFALSVLVTWTVRKIALRRQLLDKPNERSAHVRPTPRLGGIGIMSGVLPTAALVAASGVDSRRGVATILAATAFISVVGLVDDLKALPARTRFGAQCAAAAFVVWAAWDWLPRSWWLFGALPSWILAPLSLLWIVWLTNLYNFMDGIDGLAGGQAVIAGTGIAVAAAASGAPLVAGISAVVAASALGFLIFNFPPASIFMGDVGSTALGFLLACLPFVPGGGGLPAEAVALALALFILDATVTLVRRLARGERFFQAHRTHFYQRPLALGVPHRRVTLWSYAGMVLAAAGAAVWPRAGALQRAALLAGAVCLFLAYVAAVLALERRPGR